MVVSAKFREYVTDVLTEFGEVTIRPMFGGAGVYYREQMFALIADDRLFLKANDATRPAFEAEGAKPFTFKNKNGEIMAMSYLEVPSRLFDDTDELAQWARRSYETAASGRGKAKALGKSGGAPRELPLLSRRKTAKKT